MAKLRGKQKWKHCLTVQGELWALERELDSMSQKGLPVARQLGRVRSIILRTKTDEQKTMKPFINPAPNHIEREKRMKKHQEGEKNQLCLNI